MQCTFFFYLVLFFVNGLGFSIEEQALPQARLSPSGIRRLRENKQILLESLETTQKNIEHSLANQKTIENQILEVQKTEEELNKLKIQYENFIASANKELDVNREAMKKLSSRAADQAKSGEMTERRSWEQSTKKKVSEVVDLLRKLEKDSKSISARKLDLEKQKIDWSDREKKHQALLSELQTKKQSLEKQLKGDS